MPNPVINRRVYGGTVYDPVAVDYFNRAGISDKTEKTAVNNFVLGLRANNLLTSAYAIWLCSPTSIGASYHNLISSSYLLTASAAPSFSTTGWAFNGTTQFLKTGLIPSAVLGIDNIMIGARSRTNIDANTVLIGVSSSSTSQIFFQPRRVGDLFRTSIYTNASIYDVANTTSIGNFFTCADGAASRYARINTTSLGTSAAAHGNTNPTHELYIGGRNDAGTADLLSAREICSAWVFTAISTSNCDILSGLLDTYNANVIAGGR